MRIVVCDRCGRRIQDGEMIGYISVTMREEYDGHPTKDNPYAGCDFCEDCMREIVALIDADPYQEPEEEPEAEETPEEPEAAAEPEADPEPEPEPEPGDMESGSIIVTNNMRQYMDLRELRELVKEGKTPQEIADHFGITVKKYYYYRKKAEKLYIEGRL